ncbi:MAG: hypothetical protein IPG06_10635 [Haliea sp.]|nr:hypothetical protein [Haliea sp.]
MDASFLQLLLGIAIFAILFSIGIGLSIADFRQVVARPQAFVLTLACQVLLLPALAILIARIFEAQPWLRSDCCCWRCVPVASPPTCSRASPADLPRFPCP